jgi:hypothetical protein
VSAQIRPRIDEVPTLTEVIGFTESAPSAPSVTAASSAAGGSAEPVAASPRRSPPLSSTTPTDPPQLPASLLSGLGPTGPLAAALPAADAGFKASAAARRDPGTGGELALSPLADPDVPVEGWLAVAESQITQQVLSDVQRQVDRMFEYRVREVLGPVLARLTDQLIEDARRELAATLRDVVRRAVAQELARLRGR